MKLLFILLSFFIVIPFANAADPFLSDTEENGTYAEEVQKTKDQAIQSEQYGGALAELPGVEQGLKDKNNFRGTIDSLLSKAKPTPEEEKNAWSQFESTEGTEAETKFFESSEYKMNSELSKPLEKKRAFSNNLDNIKNSLDGLTNKVAVESIPVEDDLDSFFEKTQ